MIACERCGGSFREEEAHEFEGGEAGPVWLCDDCAHLVGAIEVEVERWDE